MDWDQIETKWTLMTRRIRSDWSDERLAAKGQPMPTLKAGLPATIADSKTPAVGDDKLKISAE